MSNIESESESPTEAETTFYIGHHETEVSAAAISDTLHQARDLGYDFITTHITTPAFHSRILAQLNEYQSAINKDHDPASVPWPTLPSLTPFDSTLEPQNNNGYLFGIVSPWIDLGSSDPIIAYISRQILNVEVAYAAFCGISNIIVYGPSSSTQLVQFARDIREALGLGPYIQIHVLLPTTGELESDYGDVTHLSELVSDLLIDGTEEQASGEADLYDSWERWNTVRTICNYSQKLSIALELARTLPPPDIQSRWYSEPVRILFLPRTTFLRNAKGYPVLSKQHQQLLYRFARLRFPPWMLLSDVGSTQNGSSSVGSLSSSEPTPAEAASRTKEKPKDPAPHLRYLRHLQQNQPTVPSIERFGQGYQDYLQSPLQPLSDNLESITYEVFEKDPIKYEWYERAIATALVDLAALIDETRELVIAVAGSGRGPLVTRALKASEKTGVAVQCWAVEKNPNAFVLLQRRASTDPLWKDRVTAVKSDMRHWRGPTSEETITKVDILVSELLGSFGDNELSPECLDGVQHVLNTEHGISIPQSYSALLTPISTPRIYGDLLSRPGVEKWELPYVVMLHQYDFLSATTAADGTPSPTVKPVWSFSHPLAPSILEHCHTRSGGHHDAGGTTGGDGNNEHNTRVRSVNFTCRDPGLCHGLAGYFETILYANGSESIELSTNPLTMEEKSKDMISWFPLFFPLKTPMYVPAGSEVQVNMWRQTDDRSVWYEWIVEIFEKVNGKIRRLSMSEVHSSRKHACLI